jgi:hypothetical protein
VRINARTDMDQDGIRCTAAFPLIDDVWIDQAGRHGIHLDNTTKGIINGYEIKGVGQNGNGHAIFINGDTSPTTENLVHRGRAYKNSGSASDGIRVSGANATHNYIVGGDEGVICHDNSGYGINEVSGADKTMIVGPGIDLKGNTLGAYSLVGANSAIMNYDQWASDSDTAKEATLDKLLGLCLENHVEDDVVRDAQGNKTSSILYLYDSAANAITHDKVTGVTEKYNVTATYVVGKMDLFKVVKV